MAGPKPAKSIPGNYAVMPQRHGNKGQYCCRLSVALEGNFYLVNAEGMVDCFSSYEQAFCAGTRALFTIINKRIAVPKRTDLKATELVPKLRDEDCEDIVIGYFGGYD